MKNLRKTTWPLLAALVLLGLATSVCLCVALVRTEGQLVYALDDAYIHMAIARSLAEHGVWGVSPRAFTSASSSIAWPLLLAAGFRVGLREWWPLVWNLTAAVAAVAFASRALRNRGISGWQLFLALGGFLAFTPVIPLIFIGMEHLLQTLASLWFVFQAARFLADESRRPPAALLLGAASVVAARYEGLFLVAMFAGLALARGRFRASLLVAAAGAAPAFVFGLVALGQGWSFLPNSVLLKGRAPIGSLSGMADFARGGLGQLRDTPHILMMAVAAAALLYRELRENRKPWSEPVVLLELFLGALLLHVHFASTGWFYRYEAYLVGVGFTVLIAVGAPALAAAATRVRGLVLPAAALVAVPLAARALESHHRTPQGARNVYEQQFQTARFLGRHYAGAPIALNDIGVVGFHTDVRILDLWGLADREVARAKRSRTYDPEAIEMLARRSGARVAVASDQCYSEYGGLPRSWIKVAEWRIRDNVSVGDETVSFYALDATEAPALARKLDEFVPTLPNGVLVRRFGRGDQSALTSRTSVRMWR